MSTEIINLEQQLRRAGLAVTVWQRGGAYAVIAEGLVVTVAAGLDGVREVLEALLYGDVPLSCEN